MTALALAVTCILTPAAAICQKPDRPSDASQETAAEQATEELSFDEACERAEVVARLSPARDSRTRKPLEAEDGGEVRIYKVQYVFVGEIEGDRIRVRRPWSLHELFFLNPPAKTGEPWTCLRCADPFPELEWLESLYRTRQAIFDKAEELHWKRGATRVKSIHVDYSVHFTHLEILIDEALIDYRLRLQGPGEYHRMACSDEKLQSIAQGLLAMKLFTKEGRGTGGPIDHQHNPPYVFTITFEDGTRLRRSVGHDQAFRDGSHAEIGAWLKALKDELRENKKKQAEEDEGNGE